MLTLYHNPHSRSTIVHYMLHELGEPFEIVPVDLKAGDHKTPEFLKLNPMGKIPVLADGDTIVTEAPAILIYLADKYPKAGLAPKIEDRDRAAYLRWMFFYGSCFEPACIDLSMQRETRPPRPDGASLPTCSTRFRRGSSPVLGCWASVSRPRTCCSAPASATCSVSTCCLSDRNISTMWPGSRRVRRIRQRLRPTRPAFPAEIGPARRAGFASRRPDW